MKGCVNAETRNGPFYKSFAGSGPTGLREESMNPQGDMRIQPLSFPLSIYSRTYTEVSDPFIQSIYSRTYTEVSDPFIQCVFHQEGT